MLVGSFFLNAAIDGLPHTGDWSTIKWTMNHHPTNKTNQLNRWIGQIFWIMMWWWNKGVEKILWLLTMMMTMVAKFGIDRILVPVMLQILLWLLIMIMKMVTKVGIDQKWEPVMLQLLQHQISHNLIQSEV